MKGLRDVGLLGAWGRRVLARRLARAGRELPPPATPPSDLLRWFGHRVIALGNPFGRFARTLTTGVISALGRLIENDTFVGEVIQTDAATNPCNSGGPRLDPQGRLIGRDPAVLTPTATPAGSGVALTVSTGQGGGPV